ncbi:hypothetical protein [Synechococcus sp. WH 8016]|uniref:hypothetical protein n=1 Tax=Synechococcus sp. WH 8016 TaxID=166318 RepID=UPI00022D9E02|nr:hypothetical protein [Synechococcus sp. WH 8016]EHA63396.1 hypothetical protein Syn8016DRAFT_0437 [Synechococcus sp. WH 8016]
MKRCFQATNLIFIVVIGVALTLLTPVRAFAAPGLCTGVVCADEITRSAKNHWQLRMRLEDQQGHRERVVMDCRNQQLSPRGGLVDRIPATALGRRACRLAGEAG